MPASRSLDRVPFARHRSLAVEIAAHCADQWVLLEWLFRVGTARLFSAVHHSHQAAGSMGAFSTNRMGLGVSIAVYFRGSAAVVASHSRGDLPLWRRDSRHGPGQFCLLFLSADGGTSTGGGRG